ncbi:MULTISPECIES: FadR/GntR family transcriptional regulator [unclassified Nocardioides]|uniref:FadR/GntR family transcriptional regulator n=1 Tax=unclassified Nocardioides TaxID=2615069 RepID=UPI0006F7254E|nr:MULTISPECIES: FCD domain-containing protein [unclassified Nocardioides]KQY63605.1 hypothetical protein ASD30_00930 [Nocardioides sp. Root140]KRF15622.1 hypothetical protein ASH02_02930 [Nocardioides sp. Soil796]
MKAIPRMSMADAATESLREEIAAGNWPVGHRIPPETALIESLGVSRTTVREAVRGLVHAGLLQPRQGDGTYVVATNATEVALRRRLLTATHDDIADVRRGLDVIAARLAAERRTEDQLKHLRQTLDARAAAGAALAEEDFATADVAFHLAVAEVSGNDVLAELYSSLSEAMALDLKGGQCFSRFITGQHDWHEGLFIAIRDGDVHAAATAAMALIDNAGAGEGEIG